MTVPTKIPDTGNIMEAVLLKGDLGKLTPEERTKYYLEVCKSLGLNPLTQPFQYMTLNGKLVLYPGKNCSDQLRKLHGISLVIVSQDVNDSVLNVHVKARDNTGREDEDIGVVPFPDTLRGEARSNMMMKAVTKAKRRVTLSISGLSWPDEEEIDSIPGAQRVPMPPKENLISAPGTPPEADAAPAETKTKEAGAALSVEDMAREAARHGKEHMRKFYKGRTAAEQKQINMIRDELDELVDEAEANRFSKMEGDA